MCIGIFIAALAYYPRFSLHPAGANFYPQAAQCLLDSLALPSCSPAFTYPPAFALVMAPFAPLPLWARTVLWYAVTIAATVVVYRCCERLVLRLFAGAWSERELLWLRLTSLFLSLKFILAVLENQAYDAFALAFVATGLLAVSKGQEAWGGVGLGFGAAIKATPLIFLPYLLIKRRFVAATWFAIIFLALSLLPDLLFSPKNASHGYLVTWLREIAGAAARSDPQATQAFWAGPNLLNHSLRGAVARLMDETANPAQFRTALYATWLGFAGVLGVLLLLSPRIDRFVAVDGALLVIGMLMLSPMTSSSHYVVLILPYAVLVGAVLRDQPMRRIGVLMLLASFVLLTATSSDVVSKPIKEWAYQHSLLPLGAMVLFANLALLVVRARKLRHNRHEPSHVTT